MKFKRGDRVELTDEWWEFQTQGSPLCRMLNSSASGKPFVPYQGIRDEREIPMPGDLGWVLGEQTFHSHTLLKVNFDCGKIVLLDESLVVPFPGDV